RTSGAVRDRTVADVAAVLHAGELDFGDGRVCGALGLPHRIADRSDAQDAPAGDPDLAVAIACRAGVEDLAVRVRFRRHAVETFDGIPRFGAFGIAACGEHHAERRAPVPFRIGAIERAVDSVLDEIDEIGLEPDHDWLGFGIPQPAVELQDPGIAGSIDHHARI